MSLASPVVTVGVALALVLAPGALAAAGHGGHDMTNTPPATTTHSGHDMTNMAPATPSHSGHGAAVATAPNDRPRELVLGGFAGLNGLILISAALLRWRLRRSAQRPLAAR